MTSMRLVEVYQPQQAMQTEGILANVKDSHVDGVSGGALVPYSVTEHVSRDNSTIR